NRPSGKAVDPPPPSFGATRGSSLRLGYGSQDGPYPNSVGGVGPALVAVPLRTRETACRQAAALHLSVPSLLVVQLRLFKLIRISLNVSLPAPSYSVVQRFAWCQLG